MWSVFTVLFATLLLQVIGGVVLVVGLMVVERGSVSQLMRRPPVFAAALAIGVSINALVGIAAVMVSPNPWRRRVSLPSLRASPVDVLLILVAALGIAGVCTGIAHRLGIDAHSTLRSFDAATAAASPGYLALFILIGSLAAVAEELLFRGYAQSRLSARWGPWTGIAIAALFFGGVHFDLVQGTFAFGVGLLLGWVAVERRSIATGIYAHAANNAVSFSLSWLLAGTGDMPLYATWVDVLLGAGLCGSCVFLLRRRLAQSPKQDEARLPDEVPISASSRLGVDEDATGATAPPQRGPRRVFIALGFGCLTLVAIPAVLLAGFLAIRVWSPERRAMRARASTFGAQHFDRDCLDTAISGGAGIPRDASDDLRRVFLAACLQKAQPSRSFCQGVPALSAFKKLRPWTQAACKDRPAHSRRTCGAVMSILLSHCSHHPSP